MLRITWICIDIFVVYVFVLILFTADEYLASKVYLIEKMPNHTAYNATKMAKM